MKRFLLVWQGPADEICGGACDSLRLFYAGKEPHEPGTTGFVQLVHTGIGQHLCEHLAHLILQDEVHGVAVQLRVTGQNVLRPLRVLLQRFGVLADGGAGYQHVCQIKQLLLQAAGQHGQTHDLEIYIRNQLLMTMQVDDFTAPEGEVCYTDLESILKTLVDDAVARGVCADNSTARDLGAGLSVAAAFRGTR